MPTRFALQSLENDRAYAASQLDATPAGGWGTVRIMWENRLREIEAEIDSLTVSTSTTASVAITFEGRPVVGETQIQADFASDAVSAFQRIVSAKLAARRGRSLGSRGKVSGAGEAKLYIRDLVRGSVGFLLEERPVSQATLFPSSLKTAVEESTAMIGALVAANDQDFDASISNMQPRLLAAVQSFAKVLGRGGASAQIASDEHVADLPTSAVERMVERLGEVEVSDTAEQYLGLLLGIFPDRHEFEFQVSGNAQTLHGSITDELAERYATDHAARDAMLMQPVTAWIRTLRSQRRGVPIAEQLILEDVVHVDEIGAVGTPA